MAGSLLLEKDGRVATLIFNRPEKRNPLNEEVVLEFEDLLHRVRDDRDVRVLIVTGSGNAFSAGADLSTLKEVTDPAERQRLFAPLSRRRSRLIGRALGVLANLEALTIAAINGYAIGGGWGIALGCDLRIAVAGAQFWFPEVDLGVPLSPEATSLLTAQSGPAIAKEVIITCRRYTAEELLPMGLVNRVVRKEELYPAVREMARAIAAKNPVAVMGAKATVNAVNGGSRALRLDLLLDRNS
jgi:enoyl-CoA hydratase/carnithine racemase